MRLRQVASEQQQGVQREEQAARRRRGRSEVLLHENKQQQEEKQQMSKEDALRILNALQDDEKEVQKQLQRYMGNARKSSKDW